MSNAQILAENIKNIAKAKNITLKSMLSDCDLNVNTLNQISDKKGISCFGLERIADYLDVSVDYLLGRTDEPNSTSIKTGDINGDNNNFTDSNNININRKKSADTISEKFMEVFNSLSFDKQLEVMNIALEKSKK